MGTWGSSIFRDDVAQDVRDSWVKAYQETRSPTKATKQAIAGCAHELKDEDDAPVVWLALALTLHQYGCLDAKTQKKAIDVIDGGRGLGLWEEAGQKQLAKRLAVYKEVRTTLLGPMPQLKKPPKLPRLEVAAGQVGDVVSLPLTDGTTAYLWLLSSEHVGTDWRTHLALFDVRTRASEKLPDWTKAQFRWWLYHSDDIRGAERIYPLSWNGRGVPRKAMRVVGHVDRVTDRERLLAGRGHWMPFWKDVVNFTEKAFGGDQPSYWMCSKVQIPPKQRKRPLMPAV